MSIRCSTTTTWVRLFSPRRPHPIYNCNPDRVPGVRAQHSQSVENWRTMIAGLKVVASSTLEDVVGLMAAPIRDPDPEIFFERKSLMAKMADLPGGVVSIVGEEAFRDLDGPNIRITTPDIPLPSAADLERLAIPSVDRIYEIVRKSMDGGT